MSGLSDTDLKALIAASEAATGGLITIRCKDAAEMAREIIRLRSELDIVLQNAEASASSYQERVETIHRVAVRALNLKGNHDE